MSDVWTPHMPHMLVTGGATVWKRMCQGEKGGEKQIAVTLYNMFVTWLRSTEQIVYFLVNR